MKLEEINKEIISENWNNSRWWKQVSKIPGLSEDFIDKYKDKLDWELLSKYQKLTEKQIEDHYDYVDWEEISYYQTLSENFIEKYENELNWYWISSEQKLSEDFIEEFKDKISWEDLSNNKILTSKIISKYKNKLEWEILSRNYIFNEEELINYKDLISWPELSFCHPFISNYFNNKEIWDNIDQKFYKDNILSKLYQKTKEKEWFIGYMIKDNFNIPIRFQCDPHIFNCVDYEIIKSKIYWKDLITVDKTSKYEPIRLIKSIR